MTNNIGERDVVHKSFSIVVLICYFTHQKLLDEKFLVKQYKFYWAKEALILTFGYASSESKHDELLYLFNDCAPNTTSMKVGFCRMGERNEVKLWEILNSTMKFLFNLRSCQLP